MRRPWLIQTRSSLHRLWPHQRLLDITPLYANFHSYNSLEHVFYHIKPPLRLLREKYGLFGPLVGRSIRIRVIANPIADRMSWTLGNTAEAGPGTCDPYPPPGHGVDCEPLDRLYLNLTVIKCPAKLYHLGNCGSRAYIRPAPLPTYSRSPTKIGDDKKKSQ